MKTAVLHMLAFACGALCAVLAPPIHAMGSDPQELRLSYEGEAYRAWPVVFEFQFNGMPGSLSMRPRCCLGENRAPGATGGAGVSLFYKGDVPDIALEVTWVEVHSNLAFRARLDFSTDDIVGWTGGDVIVTFSFRPGGELVLYADGPTLAATRTGPDVDIRSGADLGAVLMAPGLGRPHTRDDYIELRRVCGTLLANPPEGFRAARARFAPADLTQIDADRALPLPAPNCEVQQ